MKIFISVALLAFAGLFQEGDTAITEWTTPVIAATNADGTGTLTVPETQATDTTITTYVAVTDQTSPSTITYALGTAVSPFALSTGGALTITANLDADTTSTYTLNVVATDAASAVGTATITVSVSDIPAFGATSYTQCITDGSVADTTLTTVLASDPGDTITHSIISGNTNSDFTIDGTTGVIQVAASKTLAMGTTASYTLVIHAVDNESSPQTGSTTVSVTVSANCNSGNNAAAALGFSVTAVLVIMLVSIL